MADLKAKTLYKNKCLLYLMGMYVSIVLIRFLMALVTTSFPTVGIDEFLYYSLARSIATTGKLLFRGQSADYTFIFYPLILSPIYSLFGEGANFYRLLQLWNNILMSASVFPLFFLGKKMLGSEKKAFTAAMLCMLLPDFILGDLIFSETVLYPLFFTLMYCAYDYITENNRRSILWIGLLGGLLYSTKPGAVVPAAVFILMVVFQSCIHKKWKNVIWTLESAIIMFAVAGALWLLAKYALGYEGSPLSVYSSQISSFRELNWGVILEVLVAYPFYFIISCGIVGFIYPVISAGKWEIKNRSFWKYILVSLAIMIAGSVWAVEQVTSLNNIHLRYVAMYIPLILLFCFLPGARTAGESKHSSKLSSVYSTGIILGYLVLFCLIFGCKRKAPTSNVHAQLSLSILNDMVLPVSMQWLGNGIIILSCVAIFYLFIQKNEKGQLRRNCIIGMAVFMLINGALGYSFYHKNYFPKLEKDGLAVREMTEGKPYIYLLNQEGIVDIGVDVNNKKNNCIVYMNDFVNNLQQNNGKYIPFIPEKMRGVASVSVTPEVDTLVLDYDSFPNFKLSQYAEVASPYGHDSVFVVRFIPGKRIADSTLSNLTNHLLVPEKPGILLIYNEEYFGKPVTIKMEIESGYAQMMTINSTHEIYSVDLTPGKEWYEVRFNKAEDAFNFKTQEFPIKVSAYELSFDE